MNKYAKALLLILAFALFIGLAVFAYSALGRAVSPQRGAIPGQTGTEPPSAPKASQGAQEKVEALDFTVYDQDDNPVRLSDMLGKPIVVNFWASWCPPCVGEMPDFDQIHSELGEDVVFMMVDLVDGRRETREKGKKFVQDQGFSFPVYFDTDQDAAYTYGITSIPSTLFIDKDGYIAADELGALDAETLLVKIDLIR